MKKCLLLHLMIASIFVFGCQKAEELALQQNEILPLTYGNSWTYVDSIFVSTSVPSTDTLVSDITFRVDQELYVDRVVEEGGKSRLERIYGWQIAFGEGTRDYFGLFVIDKMVFTTSFNDLIFQSNISGQSITFCPRMQIEIREYPDYIPIETGSLTPVVQFPLELGGSLAATPAFQQTNGCLPDLDSGSDALPKYLMSKFEPLVNLGSVAVTTLAGTFDCINFGEQRWSKGIGMIETRSITTTTYTIVDGSEIDRTVDWRRSLKAYHFE